MQAINSLKENSAVPAEEKEGEEETTRQLNTPHGGTSGPTLSMGGPKASDVSEAEAVDVHDQQEGKQEEKEEEKRNTSEPSSGSGRPDAQQKIPEEPEPMIEQTLPLQSSILQEVEEPLSVELIEELATAAADPMIVEIVRSLEKIQVLKEQELANKRKEMKLAHEQTLAQLKQQHCQYFASIEPRQRAAAVQRFIKELIDMESAQAEETRWFDTIILQELDKKICEQQVILQQASVPGFFSSTNPVDIQRQARILELILALGTLHQATSTQSMQIQGSQLIASGSTSQTSILNNQKGFSPHPTTASGHSTIPTPGVPVQIPFPHSRPSTTTTYPPPPTAASGLGTALPALATSAPTAALASLSSLLSSLVGVTQQQLPPQFAMNQQYAYSQPTQHAPSQPQQFSPPPGQAFYAMPSSSSYSNYPHHPGY